MSKTHRIQIDAGACVGYGLCRSDCPACNIAIEDGRARVVAQDCIMCGHCVAICPKAAVSITGFDEPPMELGGTAAPDPQRLLDALRSRRSIRQFTGQDVPLEAIARIVEAGRLTPTGGNRQGVSFLVLKDGMEGLERPAVLLFRQLLPLVRWMYPPARRMTIDDHFFFKKAPAAIVVASKSQVDGALAAANMALMAQALGLGVLYSGFFSMAANRSPTLRGMLGLKRGEKAVTTLVLGHPAVRYHRTAPKDAASIRYM